jgi:16S rRNA (guanine527-N7)-methyltransferase
VSRVSRETPAWDRPEPGDPWPPVAALDPYARILADVGVSHGLIGPREVARLWDRHLLNCAVVAQDRDLVPEASRVIDVGAGAGLPGLVWALVRTDLTVILLEPLLRRYDFLAIVVAELGLADRVTVVRGRAEEQRQLRADVVTARAVAPLTRLAGWTLPLTRVGGRVLAFKGADVANELAAAGATLARLGAGPAQVRQFGAGLLLTPATIVSIPRLR